MRVGYRSSKKRSSFCRFCSSLGENVSKWASKSRGGEPIFSMFFRFCSHWRPFGCPWVHFPWLLGSPGIILAPFWVPWASFWHPWGPPKWCLGSAKFNANESSNQPGWVHFFLSFEIPGYHFGTLEPTRLQRGGGVGRQAAGYMCIYYIRRI